MIKLFSRPSNKLIVLNLLISLIPILFIIGYLYFDKINTETDNLKERLVSISKIGANNVSNWIDEKNIVITDIAKNHLVIAETKKLLDPAIGSGELFKARLNLERQLHANIDNHAWLQELMISNSQTGDVMFTTDMKLEMTNLGEERHFQDALENKIGMSKIYPSKKVFENEFGYYDDGIPTLLISTPITGETGINGILTARIDIFEIDPGIETFLFDFESADAYLVNSDGYIITKSAFFDEVQNIHLFQKRPELELRLFEPGSEEFTNIFQLANKDATTWNTNGYRNHIGNSVVGSITFVDGTDWHYISEIDRNEAYEDIFLVQTSLIFSVSIIVVIIIAISVIFANSFLYPIKKLTEDIEKTSIAKQLEVGIDSRKSKDEIEQLTFSFQDMQKRIQKAGEKIKQSESRYRELYDDLPDPCRTIDRNGIILDCNKAYAKILGFPKEEVIGASIFSHTSKDSITDMKNSFETWRTTGFVANREIQFKRKDGSTFPVLVSASNLHDSNGNLIGSNTIIKDISDIYTLLEIDKEKSEFASMVSHELKTPLTPIIGYCEMLEDPELLGELNSEQLESIQDIHQCAKRLERLIFDVLNAQKLDMNKMEFNKKQFKVDEFMNQVIKELKPLVKEKEIEFVNTMQESYSITSDEQKLHEVMDNLIRNAVDFVPQKNGRIEIGVKRQTKQIIFSVKDNGSGIPQNKQSHLFQKFYQVDTSITRNHGGSGLGLVICKGIVEGLGGSIWLKSKEGKGTIFYFTVPEK